MQALVFAPLPGRGLHNEKMELVTQHRIGRQYEGWSTHLQASAPRTGGNQDAVDCSIRSTVYIRQSLTPLLREIICRSSRRIMVQTCGHSHDLSGGLSSLSPYSALSARFLLYDILTLRAAEVPGLPYM